MGTLQAHIRLDVSLNIPYALLPGDPARIDHIARHLENVTELAYNREFRSISGTYKGVQVLAVSTGIGGASMGIALEELHGCGVQCAIRIGSCGALQHDIAPGQLVLAEGVVRDDGASAAYLPLSYPAVADHRLLACCCQAAQEQGFGHCCGLVRSHDSFYTDRESEICRTWSDRGILGADMETAALYTIGRLRGIATASILNNIAPYESDVAESVADYVDGDRLAMQGESNEILTALEAFVRWEEQYGAH